MKNSLLICAALTVALLNNSTAQAQAPRPGHVAPKPRAAVGTKTEGIKDGLSMQKGRVVLTELGTSNPLIADKKLVNGTTISPTGVVTATNGTVTQMSEGDLVSLTGRITTRTEIVAADSIAKVQLFDALHPGKRKKMEAEAEKKAKATAKREDEKAKAKEKAMKRKH